MLGVPLPPSFPSHHHDFPLVMVKAVIFALRFYWFVLWVFVRFEDCPFERYMKMANFNALFGRRNLTQYTNNATQKNHQHVNCIILKFYSILTTEISVQWQKVMLTQFCLFVRSWHGFHLQSIIHGATQNGFERIFFIHFTSLYILHVSKPWKVWFHWHLWQFIPKNIYLRHLSAFTSYSPITGRYHTKDEDLCSTLCGRVSMWLTQISYVLKNEDCKLP